MAKTIRSSGTTITKPAKTTEIGREAFIVAQARKEYKEGKAIPWEEVKKNSKDL